MGDDWFNACMLTYIEYDVFDTVNVDTIIQYFQGMKARRMICNAYLSRL